MPKEADQDADPHKSPAARACAPEGSVTPGRFRRTAIRRERPQGSDETRGASPSDALRQRRWRVFRIGAFLALYAASVLLQSHLSSRSNYVGVVAQFQVLISAFLVVSTPGIGFVIALATNALVGLLLAVRLVVFDDAFVLPGLFVCLATVVTLSIISAYGRRMRHQNRELCQGKLELSRLYEEVSLAEKRAAYQASHDELTDMPNLRSLKSRMAEHFASARPGLPKGGLALIKLDNMKAINSVFGTKAGDAVVSEAARLLTHSAKERGFRVARIQSGTFAAFFPDVANAQKNLPELIRQLEEGASQDEGGLSLRATAGYVECSPEFETPEKLYNAAEIALAASKTRPYDAVATFSKNLADQTKRRLMIIDEIVKARRREEFALHYQPQIDISSGRIVGAEALLRWTNRDLGNIPPDEFIPIAEQNGQIVAIGRWVLERACRDALQWPSHWRVSVNVSTAQFFAPAFDSLVAATLRDSGLSPSRLKLEITESVLIADAHRVAGILARIRVQGVAVSMDDFGTGYSSLAYLRSIPLDELKIDRSFLDLDTGDERGRSIIATIISLARRLGIATVAEGVETVAQADLLRDFGCDCIQGYLYGKPMPSTELLRLQRTESLEQGQRASSAARRIDGIRASARSTIDVQAARAPAPRHVDACSTPWAEGANSSPPTRPGIDMPV